MKLPSSGYLDLRSLALFRILFGAYLLYDIYDRLSLGKYDLAWYTDDPPYRSFVDPQDTPHRAPLHQLWFYRGSVKFEILMFSLSTLLALLFCLGLCCNGPIKFLLFLVQVSQQSKCMHMSDGSDSFSRHLLLWSCFLPMSERWSLDSLMSRGKRRSGSSRVVNSVSGLACLALTTQIVLMYLGTVFHRTLDLYSWTELYKSEWLPPQLTAVYYALSDAFAARRNWLTDFVLAHPDMSRGMALSATIGETVVPLFCFFAGQQRHWGALLLMLLHLGLFACFNLPNWQAVGFITQFLWIPTTTWDSFLPRSTAANDYKKTDGDSVPSATATKSTSSMSRPLKPNLVSLFIQLFFFSYMIYNFAGNREWIDKHDNGDIGEGLRLSQYWVMYSQVAHQTATTQLIGTTPDLRQVDLYHFIKSRGEEIKPMPQDFIITDMTSRYPSPRWERAISQWAQGKDPYGDLATVLLQGLCVLLNEDPNATHFVSVELVYKPLHMLPPGYGFRYTEQERGRKIREDQVHTYNCVAPSVSKSDARPSLGE